MQTTTTLSYKTFREGTSSRGAWKLSIFDGGDGREYSTLDGSLASKIQGNDGALFVVEYTERPSKDPSKYPPSNSLVSVEVAPEGAKASPVAAASGSKGEFRTPAQIIRSTAVETVAVSQSVDIAHDLEGFLTLAATLERFITEGLEEEPEA